MKICSTRMGIGVALALTVSLLAGCSRTQNAPTQVGSSTLRLAFSADPAPLDPDTYYEAEGEAIMSSVYEGLLRYKPDSAELVGVLATKWSKSVDGLTYTFTLRDGVTFSDGTPFDSSAAKASFQRRIDMKGGPSYMLGNVVSMVTPDAKTLVVHLKTPVAPFLDFLASQFGPLMTNPTAIKAHEVGGDHASAWLAQNSAGTGPYVIAGAVKATRYTLKANPKYRGSQPHFSTITFSVMPDFSTQLINLQGGQLDMILHGLSTRQYSQLEQDKRFQVLNPPSLFKTTIYVNPASAVFGPMKNRRALRDALNISELTKTIFADRANPSTDFYPSGMLPAGAVPDLQSSGNADLAVALSSVKNKPVVIGYDQDGALQELAGLLQLKLQDAGVTATLRGMTPSQVFAQPTQPGQRPDLFLGTENPDAAHVDTWSRIYQYKDAPVNFNGCSVPQADKYLDEGSVTADSQKSLALYVKAGIAYRDSLCWINIADVHDTLVARAGLTGMEHELPWIYFTDFSKVTEKP